MVIELKTGRVDRANEADKEALEKSSEAFNDVFWEEFQVGKPGKVTSDLTVHNLRRLNAMLSANEDGFLIEHRFVDVPNQSGVPIFEVATLQRRVYYATRLKVLRSFADGLYLFADGPRNGYASYFVLEDSRKERSFYVPKSGRDKSDCIEVALKRAANSKIHGIVNCHEIFDLPYCKIKVSKKKIVISAGWGYGNHFPTEIIIRFNPKKAFTLAGDEQQRYAGTYTFVPTTDVKEIMQFEKRTGNKSKIKPKRVRDYIR